MYVCMCVCVCVCVCVCRWCKQPSTGHPGWGAVLLTVRTAHELSSFLPWAGAVSCVSRTCNRGTAEGEWEHFIFLSLIPNPSWEWGRSLFRLIPNPSGNEANLSSGSFPIHLGTRPISLQAHSQSILGTRPISSTHPLKGVWVPVTDNVICLPCRLWQKCTLSSVTWQNTWVHSLHVAATIVGRVSMSCQASCVYIQTFSDVFPSTASVDCLVLPTRSTPSCMDVAGDGIFSSFRSTSASLANCHTSSQPSRKWWVDATEPCFQLHRLSFITCRLKWWGLIFLNKCTLSSTTFRWVWSTPPSFHKVFVGYFPNIHSLWSHLTVCIVKFYLLTYLPDGSLVPRLSPHTL